VQKGNDRTGIKNNPYRKQSPYRKCWEEAPWSALTRRESQLEISRRTYLGSDHQQSQQAYVVKSQAVHLEMKRQVNSENDDMDTQTSDSKHTWRRSGKHTRRKAGEQLEMISAPSTGRMSSAPTSAPTRRRISATARTLER
jgi:hypothetical protein